MTLKLPNLARSSLRNESLRVEEQPVCAKVERHPLRPAEQRAAGRACWRCATRRPPPTGAAAFGGRPAGAAAGRPQTGLAILFRLGRAHHAQHGQQGDGARVAHLARKHLCWLRAR